MGPLLLGTTTVTNWKCFNLHSCKWTELNHIPPKKQKLTVEKGPDALQIFGKRIRRPTTIEKVERHDLKGIEHLKTVLRAKLDTIGPHTSSDALMNLESLQQSYQFVCRLHQNSEPDPKNPRYVINRSTYARKSVYGRYYPTYPSTTLCPSKFRGFLCTQHTDIDIVNCHPALLVQIIKRCGQADRFPEIIRYVYKRQSS